MSQIRWDTRYTLPTYVKILLRVTKLMPTSNFTGTARLLKTFSIIRIYLYFQKNIFCRSHDTISVLSVVNKLVVSISEGIMAYNNDGRQPYNHKTCRLHVLQILTWNLACTTPRRHKTKHHIALSLPGINTPTARYWAIRSLNFRFPSKSNNIMTLIHHIDLD